MASGLQSAGYAALPDLLAAMRAGSNGGPFVMQADVSNSDNATTQTIEQMCILIKESITDPLTQSVAQWACGSWGEGSNDPRSIAWSCWWYAKHAIKFVLDEPAVRSMLGPSNTLEFLVSPALMLRSRKMQGDCDDFTMMICALLGCRGLGYEILTVAASPREPQTFSHVYCRAILPDGSRIPLDASHGKYPGWQVPSAHVSRLQAWDADGNPVADEGSNNWSGLQGYGYEGLGDAATLAAPATVSPIPIAPNPYAAINIDGYQVSTLMIGLVGLGLFSFTQPPGTGRNLIQIGVAGTLAFFMRSGGCSDAVPI